MGNMVLAAASYTKAITEAQQRAAEAAARAEAERLAAEKAAREESERIAAENAARAEAERIAAENAARIEADRIAAENAAKAEAEKAALEAEKKAKKAVASVSVEETTKEVEEEEEDDIYAATDLTVVWNTRDGQMIPKEAVSVEIGYGVTLTATSSNNWKSEVVDLILYDETGDYAYNFVDDSLYGLIAELSDDFTVTTDVITEKDENGFDERHFIVYCDAIAEEDVPEYDDPVIFEEDIPEYDGPVTLYEDIPEYDAPETYGDGIYW